MGSSPKPRPPYKPTPTHPPDKIATPQARRDYSREHVKYEVDMFFGSLAMLKGGIRVDGTVQVLCAAENGPGEPVALHARNLIQFLYPDAWRDSSRPTDVCAYHFLASFEAWATARPPLSDTLRRAKERADKEMAHLTTERITGTPEIKTWHFTTLGDELSTVLRAFVAAADPASLHEQVSQSIPDGAL
jgi:hypothetical protein